MIPHRLTIVACICAILSFNQSTQCQKQKRPPGGRMAVVVDERLSALRATPELTGRLIRRIGRGRLVALRTSRIGQGGTVFFLVNVSSRTHGWIQREAIVSPSQRGDDAKLFALIKSSADFDRIVRARIFLKYFVRSPLLPEVLLLFGDAAEQASERLTRDARRRLTQGGIIADSSYFLNYVGLDRYNRQGIRYAFDGRRMSFRYEGEAWREILHRYPQSPIAPQARERLDRLRVEEQKLPNSATRPGLK